MPPTPEFNEEGWCFVYGEEEWKAGTLFEKTEELPAGDLLAKPPMGRVNCITGAKLQ